MRRFHRIGTAAVLTAGVLLWGWQAVAESAADPDAEQPAASGTEAAQTASGPAAPAEASTTAEPPGETPAVPDAVEEILKTPADEEDYGDSPQCLSATRIRSTEVLDGQHVVFRIGRNTYYLVKFKNRCPLLDRNDAIMYTVRTNRLCRLDSIRSVEGAGYGSPPGPPCTIPGFTRISEEQLNVLRDALQKPRGGEVVDETQSPPAPAPEPAQTPSGDEGDAPDR